MSDFLSLPAYEKAIAETREQRMKWWHDARFGMFITYGLYAQLGFNEWDIVNSDWDIREYDKLADTFAPKPGCAREWAALAKKAGMKYMVLTTKHLEGFSLWDSKSNPFNSVNYGPHRDIVREFVDACREFGLKIGIYFCLMDLHDPECAQAAYDNDARKRFIDRTWDQIRELMTNYGKIDILWYDASLPMESWESWDSLVRNQKIRELQPDIIINNRSRLDEDFCTPEGEITPAERAWESCMTFNEMSWGYLDAAQAAPYSLNANQIAKMVTRITGLGGNLLLNIGPAPDGSVPAEAVEPLTRAGQWIEKNSRAIYGKKFRPSCPLALGNGVCAATWDGEKLYLMVYIVPLLGGIRLGGFHTPLKSVRLLSDGSSVEFIQKGPQIEITPAPADPVLNINVYELTFDGPIRFIHAGRYPHFHKGFDPLAE